jgi:hypothetical protein
MKSAAHGHDLRKMEKLCVAKTLSEPVIQSLPSEQLFKPLWSSGTPPTVRVFGGA